LPITIEQIAKSVEVLVNKFIKEYYGKSLEEYSDHIYKECENKEGFLPRCDIKIVEVRVPPTPQLEDLCKELGYKNLDDFKRDCDEFNKILYGFLEMFSDGKNFDAITWIKTIFLKDTSHMTLHHELIHTIQWEYFGPKEFIIKYINGFLKFKQYELNPTEANAYEFQDKFEEATLENSIKHM